MTHLAHYGGYGYGYHMGGPFMDGGWSWWMIFPMGFKFIISILVIMLLVALIRYFWTGRKPGRCFSRHKDNGNDASGTDSTPGPDPQPTAS